MRALTGLLTDVLSTTATRCAAPHIEVVFLDLQNRSVVGVHNAIALTESQARRFFDQYPSTDLSDFTSLYLVLRDGAHIDAKPVEFERFAMHLGWSPAQIVAHIRDQQSAHALEHLRRVES